MRRRAALTADEKVDEALVEAEGAIVDAITLTGYALAELRKLKSGIRVKRLNLGKKIAAAARQESAGKPSKGRAR